MMISIAEFRRAFVSLSGLLIITVGSQFVAGAEEARGKVDFNHDIRPILSENCYKCHGPDDGSRKANLRFDIRAEALKPAKSGEKAIVPGAPDKSEMISRVTAADPDDRMPPVKTGRTLSAPQIELLKKWIAQGAPFATHWAYVKPVRPALPDVKDKRWVKNPIDRFILARLEREKLKPSPAADRYTLIRRVSLDLTGVPPTVEEVDAFVNDHSPRAYENLVDRLLAKSAFGEHWARLWLDLARYADSAGYADDPLRTIWAYRDYVIRAFNSNKSFDRFTIEQIAGDLLDDPDEDDLIATAFHRNTMTNNEGGTKDEEFRNAAVIDRVNTTMSVWMATSMGCAQCHNHKYDPLSQQEYFRMFAFLNNSEDADRKDEAPVFEFYSEAQKQERTRIQGEIAAIGKVIQNASPESLARQAAWEKDFAANSEWTSVKPIEAGATGGTAAVSDNGIVNLNSQDKKAMYTVTLDLPMERLAGLRLESIPGEQKPPRSLGISHISAIIHPPGNNRVAGRFVRVELPGKKRFLSLAEVQVFSGETNVALKGAATQSSTAFDGPARLAIDGNTSGDYEVAKSTTHTEESDNPWWEVDLGSDQAVDRIVVWNRTGGELPARLAGARVELLDNKRQPVWQTTLTEPPIPMAELPMNKAVPIHFATVFADQPSDKFDPESVIQESPQKGSSWLPGGGKTHWLTLIPNDALACVPGSRLDLKLEAEQKKASSGQFKLLVSNSEKLADYAKLSGSILAIMNAAPASRSAQQNAQLADYYRANIDPAYKSEREKIANLNKTLATIKKETVPIMRDLPTDKRRPTHIELRGNYMALGDEVQEGVPAAFHSLPQGAPMNRLTLARWLVDENNPLTARVAANRFWEQIFGIGIVRTSEDFGSQGEAPTHPELLDWLATEFVAQKWDIKAFLKMLVTSATYCQSSRITDELQERDSDNLLLARGPRFRMAAEVVRDQALAISGLLSDKMYGPPVRPPQPSSGLTAAFGGTLDWKTSEGEDRYRRALYTEWRRTSPYPSMATFDAPTREVCALRRPRSNTPLQALVTLNDPVYFEAAQALGKRMQDSHGKISDKLAYGFRLCLARAPLPDELQRLEHFYQSALTDYQKHAENPTPMKIVNRPNVKASDPMDSAERSAWSAVGNVLLNLDETLMRP